MIPAMLAMLVVAVFSALAYWKRTPPVFMLTAGVSMLVGLTLPDTISSAASTTIMDKTLGLAFIGYALFCIGAAYKCIYWHEDNEEDTE